MAYQIQTDNEILGVGKGGTLTEAQLDGWDIAQLVRTGVLKEVADKPTTTAKTKE
jgi:hypothetical protein